MIKVLKRKYKREEEDSTDDQNIYSQGVRESMLDDDEISAVEEAFMNGYDDAE